VPEVQASFLIAIAEDDDGLTGAQPGTGRARVEPDARTFRRQTLNDGDSNGRKWLAGRTRASCRTSITLQATALIQTRRVSSGGHRP
jgi:hypothetical protein